MKNNLEIKESVLNNHLLSHLGILSSFTINLNNSIIQSSIKSITEEYNDLVEKDLMTTDEADDQIKQKVADILIRQKSLPGLIQDPRRRAVKHAKDLIRFFEQEELNQYEVAMIINVIIRFLKLNHTHFESNTSQSDSE